MLMKRSASILPSILVTFPGPSQDIQPQIIRKSPPNLTVHCTSLSLNPSPGIFHTHFFPIWPQMIYFGLIWPNNPFLVPHCLVFVCLCKVHPPATLHLGEIRPFLLCHSLYYFAPDCSSYCFDREGCVGHVLQGFGNISGIFSSKKWWGRQHTRYQQVKASVDSHQETLQVINNV